MTSDQNPRLFIPLETEELLILIQRILFVFSCILHVPALFCLFRATPPHQAMIKRYLVACQIAVILTDIHYSVLFEPITLAEVFAAYCRGILCREIGPTKAMGIFGLCGGALCLATITCIIARHQAMMPISSPWKFRKITKEIVFIIVLLSIIIPTTAFAMYPFSIENSEQLITESKLGWIRDRGSYIRVRASWFMFGIIWITLTLVIILIIAVTILFWHMFYVLNLQTDTSLQTKFLIRQSLWRLYAQLNAPILFIAFPFTVFFIQSGTGCFPFMFAVVGPSFICLHPIVHNLVLLVIFPTYRRIIAEAVCGRCRCRRRVISAAWSTSQPSTTQA